MSKDPKNDVIDLTKSFTCNLRNHSAMTNVIIDLDTTDESFYDSSVDSRTSINLRSCKRKSGSQCHSKPAKKKTENLKKKSNPFGDCPICWEELGNKPLASTKCGHVYCLSCIETSLQIEKKCPTCRSSLKGKTAYHPLYLFKN